MRGEKMHHLSHSVQSLKNGLDQKDEISFSVASVASVACPSRADAAYHPARTVKPPPKGSSVTAHARRCSSSSSSSSRPSSPSYSKPSRNEAMAFRLSPEPFAHPPSGFSDRAMTKKRPSSPISALRYRLRLGLKIVVSFAVFLFISALLRLHLRSKLPPSSTSSLGALPLRRRISDPFVGPPRIAFLFLARSNLPLDFLWQSFFQNADQRSFSIYIHSKPGFVFDDSTTRCPLFYGRQLSKSVEVAWGQSSMIEAEKLLLEEALEDPANQRFVLVSDSCVPMYNFSYMYNYVMSSPKSFVDSFLDKKEGRYNPKMLPIIPKRKWRKGSQWITLVRKHAEVVVDDDIVFPVFKKYCKRRPPLDLEGRQKPGKVIQKEHNCIPDEHYVQTLLAMSELEDELERRTLTYTLWNQSIDRMERKGWHPITFYFRDASPERMQKVKGIDRVYYETEYRTEWCRSNATSVPCFIFARKFSRGAAMRLLSGVTGPFDAAALLKN